MSFTLSSSRPFASSFSFSPSPSLLIALLSAPFLYATCPFLLHCSSFSMLHAFLIGRSFTAEYNSALHPYPCPMLQLITYYILLTSCSSIVSLSLSPSVSKSLSHPLVLSPLLPHKLCQVSLPCRHSLRL